MDASLKHYFDFPIPENSHEDTAKPKEELPPRVAITITPIIDCEEISRNKIANPLIREAILRNQSFY